MFQFMWNTSENGTNVLIGKFKDFLHTVVPTGTQNRLDTSDAVAEEPYDARMPWYLGDNEPLSLAMRFAWTSDKADIPDLAARRRATDVPVILAPYLAPTHRKRAIEKGWSYWDATGNVRIQHTDPLISIERHGASRNPESSLEPDRLLSLKGVAASRVVEHVLADPSATTVRSLAQASGVGLGTVSRVISLLRYENLLETPGGHGVRAQDPQALAERLAEDYQFQRSNGAKRYFSPLGRAGVPMALRRNSQDFAVTGLQGAADYLAGAGLQTPLPPSDLWLYVDDARAAVKAAQLEPDPRHGDIWIAEAPWMFAGQHYYASGTPRASAWRIVCDLLSYPGRHAAVGEAVIDQVLERRR